LATLVAPQLWLQGFVGEPEPVYLENLNVKVGLISALVMLRHLIRIPWWIFQKRREGNKTLVPLTPRQMTA